MGLEIQLLKKVEKKVEVLRAASEENESNEGSGYNTVSEKKKRLWTSGSITHMKPFFSLLA